MDSPAFFGSPAEVSGYGYDPDRYGHIGYFPEGNDYAPNGDGRGLQDDLYMRQGSRSMIDQQREVSGSPQAPTIPLPGGGGGHGVPNAAEQLMMQQQMMLFMMGYGQPQQQYGGMYGSEQAGHEVASSSAPTGPRAMAGRVAGLNITQEAASSKIPPAQGLFHPLRPRNKVWKAPSASASPATSEPSLSLPLVSPPGPSSSIPPPASASMSRSPPTPPPNPRPPSHNPRASSVVIDRLHDSPDQVAEAEKSTLVLALVAWADRVAVPEPGLEPLLRVLDRTKMPHEKTIELVEFFVNTASRLDWREETTVDLSMRAIARQVRISPLAIKLVYEKWRSARFCIGGTRTRNSSDAEPSGSGSGSAVAPASTSVSGQERAAQLRAMLSKKGKGRAIQSENKRKIGEFATVTDDGQVDSAGQFAAEGGSKGKKRRLAEAEVRTSARMISDAAQSSDTSPLPRPPPSSRISEEGSRSRPIEVLSDEEMEVEALLSDDPPPPRDEPSQQPSSSIARAASKPTLALVTSFEPSPSGPASLHPAKSKGSLNEKIRARMEALRTGQSAQPDSPAVATPTTSTTRPTPSPVEATSPLPLAAAPHLSPGLFPRSATRLPRMQAPTAPPTLVEIVEDPVLQAFAPTMGPPPQPSGPPPDIPPPPPPDASPRIATAAVSRRGSVAPPPVSAPSASSSSSTQSADDRSRRHGSRDLAHLPNPCLPTSLLLHFRRLTCADALLFCSSPLLPPNERIQLCFLSCEDRLQARPGNDLDLLASLSHLVFCHRPASLRLFRAPTINLASTSSRACFSASSLYFSSTSSTPTADQTQTHSANESSRRKTFRSDQPARGTSSRPAAFRACVEDAAESWTREG